MKKFICILLISAILTGLAGCVIDTPLSPAGSSTTTTTNKLPSGSSGGSSGGSTGGSISGSTSGGSTGGSTSGGTSSGGSADEAPDLSVFDAEELALFNVLFDPESHVSIRLDISDTELEKIQRDHDEYSSRGSKSPIYRMADLYVTITDKDGKVSEYKIEQVGVRMKGNTSRTSFWNDSDGMYNLVHFKLNFQETFDDPEYYGSDALVWDEAARKERKDRTFATLSKMDLRWNRNDDTTYIRERYSYDFYRSVGVLAPHVNIASVDIGSDHAGVWCIYEPIDKSFLKKNLPASAIGGDLYKLSWDGGPADLTSFNSYGVENEDTGSFYTYDLKTNKKTSDHSSLRTLINTLNSRSLTKSGFSELVEVDRFVAYCAASYLIGNPDDLRNNYNNTYIYFRADTGKMLLIPYDMDRGFGVNTWNPYGDGMTTDSPFADRNVCGSQRNPLFTKTVQKDGFLVDEYVSALSEISKSTLLSPENFSSEYETARRLYSDEVSPSKSYGNCGGYRFTFDLTATCNKSESKNMSFSDYITQKLSTLAKHLNAYTPSTGEDGDGDGDGEDDTPTRPPQKPDSSYELYIRGDFTGWGVNNDYKMTNTSEGVFSITLTRDSEFQFKLYDKIDDEWYGGDLISLDCEVDYRLESNHKNIILSGGTYLVELHTATGEIFITQK